MLVGLNAFGVFRNFSLALQMLFIFTLWVRYWLMFSGLRKYREMVPPSNRGFKPRNTDGSFTDSSPGAKYERVVGNFRSITHH